MKKIIKSLLVFSGGVALGYYVFINKPYDIFKDTYNAFQVGVYTDKNIANTYKTKYKDAIIIKDNELYRVYVSILKEPNNIERMSNHLNKNNTSYYLKEISINNKELKNKIDKYESIMNNKSEIVFLEINKMIVESYGESYEIKRIANK